MKINIATKSKTGFDIPSGAFVNVSISSQGLGNRVSAKYYKDKTAYDAGSEAIDELQLEGKKLPASMVFQLNAEQYANLLDGSLNGFRAAHENLKNEIETVTGAGTVEIINY